MTTTPIPGLIGKTVSVIVGAQKGSRSVIVATEGDDVPNWRTPASQTQMVADASGNPSHLLGTPLTDCAETVAENADLGMTVTTVTFRTVKGEFVIRWLGPAKATLAEIVEA